MLTGIAHPACAAGGGPIAYQYDELGRLVGVIAADGNTAAYSYDAVGNILAISRTTAGKVVIVGFTPNGGPDGTEVTITGSGFSPDPAKDIVTFNGTATTVVSAMATQIVARVPAGATTGPIAITTNSATAASTAAFVVQQSRVPTISSFTPSIGVPGTLVSVNGTNYDPATGNDKVGFNGRLAVPSSASATSLQVRVPANTASGQITVATAYGTALSGADFFVPPPPYTAADILVMDRMSIGASKTVAIATAGKKALILFDGVAGQRVSLNVTAVAADLKCFTLRILKPDGSGLISPNRSCGPTFVDATTLPVSGTYTILMDADGTATGNATFTLFAVPQDPPGSIATGGPAVTLTASVPGQNPKLTFSGTAGQRIALNVTAVSTTLQCLYVRIFNPDGSNLISPTYFCGTTFVDATTLPTSGIYTIAMDPIGTATGSATFTLFAVPQDPPASIATGGPAVTLTANVPGQNPRLAFSGTAGQRVSLNVTAVSDGLNCLSVVWLLNPDGSVLASKYPCGPTFLDATTLPTSGTYTIMMDPAGMATGSATFTLFAVPDDPPGSIAIGGPAVTLTANVPGQNPKLTFSGTAGQRISLNFTAVSAALKCFAFSIFKPDGSSLVSTYLCGAAFVEPTTLPVTGAYGIVLDPVDLATGSATLALFAVPEDPLGSIAIGGPAVTLTASVPGQNPRLTFSGTVGQRISLTATPLSTTLQCIYVRILKPDGSNLIPPKYACGAAFVDTNTLPATGTYTIVLDPAAAATGSATVVLFAVPDDPGSIAIDGPAVTLTVSVPGQNPKLTFSGTAGQGISLKVNSLSTTLKCLYVWVLKPDGSGLIAKSSCSPIFVDAFTLPATALPATGTYTIVMDPLDAGTGSGTFTLSSGP
jgi:YD repeat-containing protein